jgi:hypothetical protein
MLNSYILSALVKNDVLDTLDSGIKSIDELQKNVS